MVKKLGFILLQGLLSILGAFCGLAVVFGFLVGLGSMPACIPWHGFTVEAMAACSSTGEDPVGFLIVLGALALCGLCLWFVRAIEKRLKGIEFMD